MYKELRNLSTFQQVEKITVALVNTLSINGTKGEVEIANKVEAILQSFPYFQKYPSQIWTQFLPNDSLGRKNVFARLKGRGTSKKTVIFHSHLDTVGIEDFGQHQSIANSPEQLLHFFKDWDGNMVTQQQALSGDWMFGRGSLDMKSGIAVHLSNVLYFSEHLEEWEGEIIFMANPVEENQHTGIIAAVDELISLCEEEGLEYVVAINNDYISPLFLNDSQKYIYTGAGGKLLPCFYVYGRETHVGQTLGGLDPTLVTSELNRLINNNMDLTEQMEGEMIIPPAALYHRDTKASYDVQTSVTSHIYFNFMVLEASPKQIMEKLKCVAIKATQNVKQYYQEQYAIFSKVNDFPSDMPSWDVEVFTYEEYRQRLTEQGLDIKSITEKVVEENAHLELRELYYKIVDTLRKLDKKNKPCVIIFYAPPYCPHHYLKGDTARDCTIIQSIEKITEKWESMTNETFAVKRFFPYLTDSSYLSFHDSDDDVASLINNFPVWDNIYSVPVHKIRELNIPAINVGVYGLDAHRWTERVYKPYSFDTLPHLIRDMSSSWLKVSVEIDKKIDF